MRDDGEKSISPPTTSSAGSAVLGPLASLSIDDVKKPFERPPFNPSSPTPSSPILNHLTSQTSSSGQSWSVSLARDVHFARAGFFSAVKDLALHPERNSSVILRADPLPPRPQLHSARPINTTDGQTHGPSPELDSPEHDEEATWLGMERREEFRLRLMPKQVKRDGKLDQRIAIYQSRLSQDSHEIDGNGPEVDQEDVIGIEEQGMVLMIPEVKTSEDFPYYHPPVVKLAFLYESVNGGEHRIGPNAGTGTPDESTNNPIRGRIYIAYLPFPEPPSRERAEQIGKAPTVPGRVNPLIGAVRRTVPKRSSPLSQTTSGDQDPARHAASSHAIAQGSSSGCTPTTEIPANDRGSPQFITNSAEQHRLERTLRALLEKVYKYGYNSITPYQKRVHHDVVVQKESFQDLYLELKERHRHLESRAPKPGSTKVEDVKRHVWKAADMSAPSDPSLPLSDISHWGSQDVAIAAFLMLLWKDMYPVVEPVSRGDTAGSRWDTWGRPTGGFVDLGCGNGLLVHILTSEGYTGKGYELRARRTWPLYPPETREALVELPIDFPTWFPDSVDEWKEGLWKGRKDCPIKEGSFIIGNHADEITPWIPLLSLIPSTPVPFLSLPCCFHTLDGPYTNLNFTPPPHPHSPSGNFAEGLEDGLSRYKSYIMWLGWCGLICGWEWEKESLRIPSTKGWAIVARRRWTTTHDELRACRVWALEQVDDVRLRGAFRVREREGRDH